MESDSQCVFTFTSDGVANTELINMTLTSYTTNLKFKYGTYDPPSMSVTYADYVKDVTNISIEAAAEMYYSVLVYNIGEDLETFQVSFSGIASLDWAFMLEFQSILWVSILLLTLLI